MIRVLGTFAAFSTAAFVVFITMMVLGMPFDLGNAICASRPAWMVATFYLTSLAMSLIGAVVAARASWRHLDPTARLLRRAQGM